MNGTGGIFSPRYSAYKLRRGTVFTTGQRPLCPTLIRYESPRVMHEYSGSESAACERSSRITALCKGLRLILDSSDHLFGPEIWVYIYIFFIYLGIILGLRFLHSTECI